MQSASQCGITTRRRPAWRCADRAQTARTSSRALSSITWFPRPHPEDRLPYASFVLLISFANPPCRQHTGDGRCVRFAVALLLCHQLPGNARRPVAHGPSQPASSACAKACGQAMNPQESRVVQPNGSPPWRRCRAAASGRADQSSIPTLGACAAGDHHRLLKRDNSTTK